MGKDELSFRFGLGILAKHLYQTSFTTQINDTRIVSHGRIPIEVLVNQALVLEIIRKDMGLRIIYRQAILSGNPQMSVQILDNTLHTSESQSVFGCQGLKMSTRVFCVLY